MMTDAPFPQETMMPDRPRYVDVAVDGALPGTNHGVFTYDLGDTGVDVPLAGQLVWVPLRNRLVHGIVTDVHEVEPPFSTRPVKALVEPPIILPEEVMDVARWMAHETASAVFPCAALFLPPGRKHKAVEVLSLDPDADPMVDGLTAMQQRVIDLLVDHDEMTLDQVRAATGQPLTSVVPDLIERGLIRRELRPEDRTPAPRVERFLRLLDADAPVPPRATKQLAVLEHLTELLRWQRDADVEWVPLADLRQHVDADGATLEALAARGAIELAERPVTATTEARTNVAPSLNAPQAAAWLTLERALNAGDPTPHLLFGVTGSGKTEVYLRAVAWCLRKGRTSLVLVPEIALATQVVRRFIDRFPGQVAVLHSQLTDTERYEIWQNIAAEEVSVVVGPRSVLFTPVSDLGVIIIDEEHDGSYKQDSEPRYHARAVAAYIAAQRGASMVIGSATPAIESYWRAQAGAYRLLTLPERVGPIRGSAESQRLELPEVEIVDLKAELRQGHTGLLSRVLIERVDRSLSRGEQAIVLLNRRGMSTVVLCRQCGHRLECPQCDIPLVFHKDRQELICHRCDYRIAPPASCPECAGRLDFFGAGTQRVEDEVRKQFPDARVMRWDLDAVRQGGGYASMLGRVEEGLVDIIVGTQMVSKGFDLPGVTSIGVVQADSLLYLPDFRSAERTFQLLTQVAGRAGRRGPGSTVVFQTYTPEHYAIQAASRHDYLQFYGDEIAFREDFRFPPFVRLARFLYRHDKEQGAALEAGLLARDLARFARVNDLEMEMLGPTPAFVAKIRNQYQWQIVVRTREMERMLEGMPMRPGWVVDIDPESML
jgi:primosomal protein N' (replication factor Y)